MSRLYAHTSNKQPRRTTWRHPSTGIDGRRNLDQVAPRLEDLAVSDTLISALLARAATLGPGVGCIRALGRRKMDGVVRRGGCGELTPRERPSEGTPPGLRRIGGLRFCRRQEALSVAAALATPLFKPTGAWAAPTPSAMIPLRIPSQMRAIFGETHAGKTTARTSGPVWEFEAAAWTV